MILKHSKTISCVSNRLKACWLRWTLSCCVWQRYTGGILGQYSSRTIVFIFWRAYWSPWHSATFDIQMTSNADYLYFCFQRDATASWKEHGQRFTNIICQKPLALSGPCWTWTNRTPNGELIGVQLLLLWIGIHRKSHNKLQTSTNHTMPVQSAILGPRADALSIGILRSFSFRPGRGLVQDSVDKNGFPWHKPSRNNCKIL